jgi:hypothetical protein
VSTAAGRDESRPDGLDPPPDRKTTTRRGSRPAFWRNPTRLPLGADRSPPEGEGVAEPHPPARRTQPSAVRASEVSEHDALEGARPCRVTVIRSISPTSRKGSDFNSTPNDGATLWIAANCGSAAPPKLADISLALNRKWSAETALPGWGGETRSAPGDRQGVGGASPLR